MMKERVSRRWNTSALLAIALLAAVPQRYLPLPSSSAAGFIVSGTLALIIVGFWLHNLECARKCAYWIWCFSRSRRDAVSAGNTDRTGQPRPSAVLL
jgi:hypothetical protein